MLVKKGYWSSNKVNDLIYYDIRIAVPTFSSGVDLALPGQSGYEMVPDKLLPNNNLTETVFTVTITVVLFSDWNKYQGSM